MGALGHDSIETIIAAKSFVIRFYLADLIDSFVEVIPTDLVYKADPINKTDTDLGPKFGSRFRFPSLYGANMRLADADDTLAIMLLHPLLLTKHFRDHQKILVGALAIGARFVRNVNELFACCTGFVEQRDIGWAGDIRRRTLGNLFHAGLIADLQFFLDNQGRHPDGQRQIANPTIRKGLYAGRFELLPRNQFGKLNPFVVGR